MGLKRKHTIMFNASSLYIYIEISLSSLISFFSLFKQVLLQKMKEKKQKSDALKHTINNSFMVTVQNLFVGFFGLFLLSKGHFSQKKVLQLTKKEENLSKSQYRYRSIIKNSPFVIFPPTVHVQRHSLQLRPAGDAGGYSVAHRYRNCDSGGLKILYGSLSPFHTETEHTENHTGSEKEGGRGKHNIYKFPQRLSQR